jgi:hypothetical protein
MKNQCPHPERVKNILFLIALILLLVDTQPLIQWVQGAISQEVKWPGREADHAPHLMPRLIIREPITVAARSKA